MYETYTYAVLVDNDKLLDIDLKGDGFPALGVDGKGSITRKRFCLSSLIS